MPDRGRVLKPGLYVLTDSAQSRGRGDEEVVRAAVRGGATVVQLREKNLNRLQLRELGLRLRDICADGGATFIVNDDPVLARELEADGVHLGPEDPNPAEAREILGPRAIVGWSAKGSVQIASEAAGLGVTYVAAGSIYPTGTKSGAVVVGLEMIGSIKRASGLPVAAIGGISLANAAEVVAAGADFVCAASAVVAARDVEDTCRRFAAAIQEALVTRG